MKLSAKACANEFSLSASGDGGCTGHQSSDAWPTSSQLRREERWQLVDVVVPVGRVESCLRHGVYAAGDRRRDGVEDPGQRRRCAVADDTRRGGSDGTMNSRRPVCVHELVNGVGRHVRLRFLFDQSRFEFVQRPDGGAGGDE